MEKKKRSKLKLTFNIITYTVAAFAVLLIVLFLSLAITSRQQTDMPRIFGVSVVMVETGSMEPTFNAGDLIVISRISQAEARELSVDDVITFRFLNPATNQIAFNTHRITRRAYQNGAFAGFWTKGDANTAEDSNFVHFANIVGSWGTGSDEITGTRIGGLGSFFNFLSSLWGFLILIVLPLLLFTGYRVYILIKVIYDMRMEKVKESQPAAPEDYDNVLKQLEEVKAQLEAAQKGKKSDD